MHRNIRKVDKITKGIEGPSTPKEKHKVVTIKPRESINKLKVKLIYQN